MWVNLTEQSAEILLTEEEVQTLVEGKEVVGSPSTTFLSPFGRRIVIVRQAGLEEIRAREKGGKLVENHNEKHIATATSAD